MPDDDSRWPRIWALLDALESVPPAEREDDLARRCPDPELRREVLAVLAAEAAAGDYLENFSEALKPRPTALPDLSGKSVGVYRLLHPIGRGGMGVVYEAERTDGNFEQRVAVKLLTTALTGSEAHRRFIAERRILAGLAHPAIARIIDGGVTGDGTPWFAMEYVEGLPLDAYCDQHELGIRKRLELFVQVCDAVEHAHRRLVVHRDLKPANVLVTADGQVKLLDFGIAKLADTEEGLPDAPPTRTALRLMTPEYASPEQVRGKAVTTASDVYQLGLLLYELLTGHRPYDLRQRTAGELERVICEQPPTRLSAAVTREDTLLQASTGAANPVEELCRNRGTTLKRLRRRLRGDLENILGKALSKEPERRYGSADRLAQDVRRHLGDLPVAARSDTMVYRGRKFLQRHAMGAAAVTAMIVLVGAITGVYLVQLQDAYQQAESERVQAQVERDRAETEAQKARQVSNFLADIFQSADPYDRAGANISARELVDRGALKVDQELAGQPEVQAEMLRVLGRTYASMSHYESAEALLTRALELQQDHLGPRHPDIARTLSEMAWVRHWQGRFAESGQLQEQAIDILDTSLGDNTPELAEALRRLALTYQSLGESESRILPMLERALSIQEKVSGRDALPVAKILNQIGIRLNRAGAYDEAERVYQRALAIYERALGPDSGGAGGILVNLASVKANLGNLEGAEATYRRALAVIESSMGPDHRGMSTVLFALGALLTDMDRGREAVELLERAIRILANIAPDHLDLSGYYRRLGIAYLTLGDMSQARQYFQIGLALEETPPGNDRSNVPSTRFMILAWQGWAEILASDNAAAETHMAEALENWYQAPWTRPHPEMRHSLRHLAYWLTQQQRCAEAKSLLEYSLEERSARRPAFDISVDELEAALAECREE